MEALPLLALVAVHVVAARLGPRTLDFLFVLWGVLDASPIVCVVFRATRGLDDTRAAAEAAKAAALAPADPELIRAASTGRAMQKFVAASAASPAGSSLRPCCICGSRLSA